MIGHSKSGSTGYVDHQRIQSQHSSFGSHHPDSNHIDPYRQPPPPQHGQSFWQSYCGPQCGPPPSLGSQSFGGGSVTSNYDNVGSHSAQTQQSNASSAQHQQQTHGTVRSFVNGIISPFVNCVQPQISACISGPTTEWKNSSTGIRRTRNDTRSDYVQHPTPYQHHYQSTPTRSHYPAPLARDTSTGSSRQPHPPGPHNSQYSQQHHDHHHSQSGSASTSRVLTSSNGVTYNSTPSMPVSRNPEDSMAAESTIATIAEPNENDVLCGRGNNSNRHPGNIHFRELIAANKVFYSTLTKKEKMLVARQIVDIIHHGTDPPGRFISRDTMSNDGLWYDIGLPRSLEKTSQALREKSAAEKLLQHQQQHQSEKDHTMSPVSSSFSADDRPSKEIETHEVAQMKMPLSPPSSMASGTTVTDDTTPEEMKSTFGCGSNNISVAIGGKSRSRASVEPPPIKIPNHLKSIYHKVTDKQNKSSSSSSAEAVSPTRASSKFSEYGTGNLPLFLQTPPLSDQNFHSLPPYPHQKPHVHQHANYGNFHHYSASGFHQLPSYPLPAAVSSGSYRYHSPHQNEYLRPRMSRSGALNEHHVNHGHPPQFMASSTLHTRSAAYYSAFQHERPPTHPSVNGIPYQRQHPHYSLSGPNIVTPNATHEYGSGDVTPTIANRKVIDMDENETVHKLRGPALVGLDDDLSKQRNYSEFKPPLTTLSSKDLANNARDNHDNKSFTVSPQRNSRNVSPTPHQDFKRQKTNNTGDRSQSSRTEPKIDTNQNENLSKTFEASSALSQAISTQLSLEDKIVGSRLKNTNKSSTSVVDGGSKLLSGSEKGIALTSPSALTQGRSRPRSINSGVTNISTKNQLCSDDAMDGLAALSAAAFLRLDESD